MFTAANMIKGRCQTSACTMNGFSKWSTQWTSVSD